MAWVVLIPFVCVLATVQSSGLMSCTFEDGLCDWVASGEAANVWQFGIDHFGIPQPPGQDWYGFIQKDSGKWAYLASPEIQVTSVSNFSFTIFQQQNYGHYSPRVELFVYTVAAPAYPAMLWTQPNNDRNIWKRYTVSLRPTMGRFRLQFQFVGVPTNEITALAETSMTSGTPVITTTTTTSQAPTPLSTTNVPYSTTANSVASWTVNIGSGTELPTVQKCKADNVLINADDVPLGCRPDLCTNGTGHYRVPDCSYFLKCVDHQAYAARCPAGFVFDYLSGQKCDWPHKNPECRVKALP